MHKDVKSDAVHKKVYAGVTITLVRGDIADQSTDAVVNAANNQLWMGSGVAGAIKRKGGVIIEEEAMKKGPIRVGQAVTTGAGKLKACHVIHAAAMGDGPTDVAGATRATFAEARRLRLASLSLPALGTGVAGVPIDECAESMLSAAVETARNAWQELKEIRFVLWTEQDLKTFHRVLEGL